MKRILALIMALSMCLAFTACGGGGGSRLSGKWEMTNLYVEPQYRFVTARDATVNQIADAFPEIGSTVEFTGEKYDGGYKMISQSKISSYSLLSDNRISVGEAVGTYELSGDRMIIEFKDIAKVTLEKK